jgi:hypothetical protein
MTHPRGGSAVIGGIALVTLVADMSVLVVLWDAYGGRFGWAFVFGIAAMLVTWFVAKALGAGKPVGNRLQARQQALGIDRVLGQMILLSAGAAVLVGRHAMLGIILGHLAFLACLFAFVGLRAAVYPRPSGTPAT